MSKLNSNEKLFDLPKRAIFVVFFFVLVLSATAIGLTVAGLAWQQVIDVRPASTVVSDGDSLLVKNRREGLFEVCPLGEEEAGKSKVARVSSSCQKRSYGYYPEDADQSTKSVFKDIVGEFITEKRFKSAS
ncbi:hypothetical protein FBUS_09994 [Fasciolopsis buskii]|uniref:Uncharacterized protein n=1 Tax=Fasciolopsis buskii TaxID=27845 RepID=A0A8E0VCU2_9TREM|nr:hypothetical protein FBUS_09994 [Fasciolopsis buski]